MKTLPTGVVIVSNGVGYRVNTPTALTDGDNVELYVTTIVREDAFTLYAFGTTTDQRVFDALCAVTGVGPSSALALLRDVGATEIARAVFAKDHRPLTRAKGVGAKVAERIVAMVTLPPVDVSPTTPEIAADSDAIAALETLGYERGVARIAVATARERGAHDTRVLVADALGVLRAG